MKKDKLITIRVNSQVRDKFNQWCSEKGLSVSEFLSNIIEDCASGDYDMSSNNKEKSNKIARQKLIALEARFEQMSSQLASLTQMPQYKGEQPQFYSDIIQKVEVLEKQIEHLSRQSYSISSLIDDKLDKNELDALVQSKLDSLFDLNSLYQRLDNVIDKKEVETLVRSLIGSTLDLNQVYQRLDNKLDTSQVEVLVETKIDSVLSTLLEKLDGKLDKEQLEVLVKSQVESILTEGNLGNQIDSKLHNTIDKQELQTLVDSILNEDSLLKVIDKMIDDKLMTVVSPTLDVAEGGNMDNQEDVCLTENEVLSIDNSHEQIRESETEIEKQVSQLQRIETHGDNISTELTLPLDLTVIPQAFLDLPKGKVETKTLAQTIGFSSSARVSELASGKKKTLPFPEFWEYLSVETTTKTLNNGKQVNSYEWTKIK